MTKGSVDQLTKGKQHEGTVADLNRLIRLSELGIAAKGFLLSCKVDRLSPKTVRFYDQQLWPFVRACEGSGMSRPQDITATHVRAFLLERQERVAPISVHATYRALKRWFNWMVAEETIPRSPMANMKPPRIPRKVVQPFSNEQIKALLAVSSDGTFIGTRNKAAILLMLDTGLRLSEVATIKLSDVDMDNETIRVMGKGAKERVVRIGTTAQKALLRYLLMRHDNHDCLWVTEERRPLTVYGFAQIFRRLKRQVSDQLPGVRISAHTLRHTFTTQALLAGAGLEEVQSLLGHASLQMVLRYAQTIRTNRAIEGHRRWSPADHLR